jgi:hypothetical protein
MPVIFDWDKINKIETLEGLELELKRIELKERGALREFRSFYSKAISLGTVCWILAILTITVLCGIRDCNNAPILSIDNKVLIVLISTTTLNVFGFFVLVVKYMFASPKEPRSIENKKEIGKTD